MFEAQPWADAWVGRLTEDVFVGIRIDDPSGVVERVVAYLSDSDGLALLLDGERQGSQAVLADDAVEVELEVTEEAITGTVSLAGEEPASFTAEPATGVAGVYVVDEEQDRVDTWAGWVVLADGDVRGSNVRCFINPRTGERICFVVK